MGLYFPVTHQFVKHKRNQTSVKTNDCEQSNEHEQEVTFPLNWSVKHLEAVQTLGSFYRLIRFKSVWSHVCLQSDPRLLQEDRQRCPNEAVRLLFSSLFCFVWNSGGKLWHILTIVVGLNGGLSSPSCVRSSGTPLSREQRDLIRRSQVFTSFLPDADRGESAALPWGLLQKQRAGGEWPSAAT